VAKIAAVIFDYYETLAALSQEIRERAFDELAVAVGAQLPPGEAFEQYRDLTTKDWQLRLGGRQRPPLDGVPLDFVSFRDVWLRRSGELFAVWGVDVPAEVGAQMYFTAHAEAALYPDARPAIEALRARYRLAILSDADTDFLHGNLTRQALAIDTIVTSEDVCAYKPHVSMFREVCARLDVEPAQAVYVGDSPWADVAGARHAGLRAVWINRHLVDWPDDIDLPEAMITSLSELPETIAQL
jgi:2-haloalkanoic acid dehalogenase type II